MITPSADEESRNAPELTGAHRAPLSMLALAAIGIVFGDIGTSPLYTHETVFDPANGLPLNQLT